MKRLAALLVALLAAVIATPGPQPAPPADRPQVEQVGIFDRLRLRKNQRIEAGWGEWFIVEDPPAPAQPVPAPPAKKFARGAKPSPRYKLQAATPFVPLKAAPAQFAIVPPKLSYWYNDRYGICVTSQEAVCKAAWSIQCGLAELFVPDEEVLRWATKYGFRDGADLAEVMDRMQKDGFTVAGQNYKDGPYFGVDYSNEAVLQAAIASGPVNIAIDADALPSGAGNDQGWWALGNRRFPNTDHCVALLGYGPAEYLFKQLGVALPAALAGKSGYLLFTWSTIGFVDHSWLMNTCVEAWVRKPTTPGQIPPDPGPGPTPTPGKVFIELTSDQVASVLAQSGGVTGGTIIVNVPAGTPGGTYTIPAVPVPDPEPAPGWVDDGQVFGQILAGMKKQGASDTVLEKLANRPILKGLVLRAVFRKMAKDPVGQKLLAQYKSGDLPASWLTDFLDWLVANGPAILKLIMEIIALFG